MEKLGLLFMIALRNLRSHRVKTLIVTGIIAFGTFLLVLGTSLLESIESAMERSITSSLTGHVQVWSADADEEFAIFANGPSQPDIGELDFPTAQAELAALPGVKEVVPMAIGAATTFGRSEVDLALDALRDAVDNGDPDAVRRSREQVQLIADVLIEELENELAISAAREQLEGKLAIAREVRSDAFWARFEADRTVGFEFLDTKFAPLSTEGQFLYMSYLATDPGQYAKAFDRFQVVDGEMIPPGRRGLMLSKFFYEKQAKNRIARELDELRDDLRDGALIAEDAVLQNQVERMVKQYARVVFQLDRAGAEALGPELRAFLKSDEQNLAELVQQFLRVDDANFEARYAFFYETIAPKIQLYAVKPGDVIVLQSFTKTGYFKSVNVRIWGTFNFQGLETSDLAGVMNVLDLVTFRELYGKMTDAQKAELAAIQESVGVEAIARDDVEDSLFGEPTEVEGEGKLLAIDAQIPEQLGELKVVDDRVYSADEMRNGLALNIALILDDPRLIKDTIARVNALEGLQATDWQTAAGIVGQFVFVTTLILYVAILIIFLVALVIINNSMLMAMMERIGEIGTIRAIGGQRREVLAMVLMESAVTSVVAGLLGTGLAVALITYLGAVGIPAPSDVVVFLFGGPRLFPFVSVQNIGLAFVVILVVTLLSTLYPARIATGVQPVVAMRGN